MSSPFTFIRERTSSPRVSTGTARTAARTNTKLQLCLNDPRLWKLEPKELATKLGVSTATVCKARRINRGGTGPSQLEVARRQPDLGIVRDSEIAEREGISNQSVSKARRQLGIMSFQERQLNLTARRDDRPTNLLYRWPRSQAVANYVSEIGKSGS